MEFDLECSRDGKIRIFKSKYSDEGSSIRFIVMNETGITFNLMHLNDNELRISDMYIDNQACRGIGMPDALILKAKELLDKIIVSSPNALLSENTGEHLHKDGKKVWERLVAQDKAMFDEKSGRYKTV